MTTIADIMTRGVAAVGRDADARHCAVRAGEEHVGHAVVVARDEVRRGRDERHARAVRREHGGARRAVRAAGSGGNEAPLAGGDVEREDVADRAVRVAGHEAARRRREADDLPVGGQRRVPAVAAELAHVGRRRDAERAIGQARRPRGRDQSQRQRAGGDDGEAAGHGEGGGWRPGSPEGALAAGCEAAAGFGEDGFGAAGLGAGRLATWRTGAGEETGAGAAGGAATGAAATTRAGATTARRCVAWRR